jgi:hypothetical protein
MSEIVSTPNITGQGAVWWFRITIDDASEIEKFDVNQQLQFVEVQAQVEDSDGHLHIQGLVRCQQRIRFTSLIKKLACIGYDAAKIRVGRLVSPIDLMKMRKYVNKEETRVAGAKRIAFGEPQSGDKEPPAFVRVLQMIREFGETEALKKFITMGLKASSWEEAKKLFALEMKVQNQEKIENAFSESQLRPWQKDLMAKLTAEADARKIYCIYDKVGNAGKTWFCRYMKAKFPERSVLVNNGKAADIAFVMHENEGADIVLFQLQRSVEEHVNYQILEQVKDNVFVSSKYQSSSHVGVPLALAVFTNFPLNWEQLSTDRWEIWKIDQNGDYKTYTYATFKMMFPDELPLETVKRARPQELETEEPPAKKPAVEKDPTPNKCPLECYETCCAWRMDCPDKGRGTMCKPHWLHKTTKCDCSRYRC